MANLIKQVAVASLFAVGAVSAQAASYSLSFASSASATPYATFDITTLAPDVNTGAPYVQLESITGSVGGNTITGLLPRDSYGGNYNLFTPDLSVNGRTDNPLLADFPSSTPSSYIPVGSGGWSFTVLQGATTYNWNLYAANEAGGFTYGLYTNTPGTMPQSSLFLPEFRNDQVAGYYTHGDLSITAPVPEPETYAMFLAGIAALGVVSRRRKVQQA
jgi:PEP-CTERM motif